MTVKIGGFSKPKSILVISQEVVPLVAFNNLVDHRFKEFDDDTIDDTNGSILRQALALTRILKTVNTVGTFNGLGKKHTFMQRLNIFARTGDNSRLILNILFVVVQVRCLEFRMYSLKMLYILSVCISHL